MSIFYNDCHKYCVISYFLIWILLLLDTAWQTTLPTPTIAMIVIVCEDLLPRQSQVQIPLNRSVDHWTTTSETVTEELMSPSDLDNAAQLYQNPPIEEITDDPQMPNTN